MEKNYIYEELRISRAVLKFGNEICAKLKARFDEIDRMAERNQAEVILVIQKNR